METSTGYDGSCGYNPAGACDLSYRGLSITPICDQAIVHVVDYSGFTAQEASYVCAS